MSPQIVVTMVVDGDVIWRVSQEIKPTGLVRMGLQEYEAVAQAAEMELYEQIKKQKKDLTPAPAGKGKK